MQKGSVQKGNDAVASTDGDDAETQQQQPQTQGPIGGLTGDPGYYYQQQFAPMPYGYHMTDEQWAAHEQMMQQQGYQQYHLGYHYPPLHMEGVPLPPGIPGLGGSTDPLEAVLGRFPCARLRNIPYDISIEDVLMLFQGLVVIDVVLHGGGDAFVVFANPMDFQMALQRNRQTIGRRYIDIIPATRTEYYEAVSIVHEQERGLKISSAFREDDILRHTMPREIQPSGDTASTVAALWGHTSPSPPMQSLSGQSAFVDPMNLGIDFGGGRGLSRREPGRSVLHAPPQKRSGGGIQVGEHTGFLRMRGLPFSVGKEDVYKFFFGYNPILESIVLTYRNDGRATGECYIGFETADDAERAMALHRRSMGNRYVELFISNKEEQSRALARFANR